MKTTTHVWRTPIIEKFNAQTKNNYNNYKYIIIIINNNNNNESYVRS